jgi:pimeloyl-ACP methyl ester carboxylesterase
VGGTALEIGLMTSPEGTAARGTIVCLHGAFEGGWCFERFVPVLTAAGWTCRAPDHIGHGARAGDPEELIGCGLVDYRAELAAILSALPEPTVLVGHSMGAVLAQQLAADGLASALVLVGPAPRAGLLPATESERQAARGFMSLGPFWTGVIHPVFEVAAQDSLNRLPEAERRAVFDRFDPESGQALFELFFWMFDEAQAAAVDVEAVRCPVLCLSGSDDRVVSPATARETAASLANAVFREAPGRGHMLPLEPGAEALASDIAAWLAALPEDASRRGG